MENKIIDMTEMTDEAFDVAKKCIDAWKADGAPLTMTYQTVEEGKQFGEAIRKGLDGAYQSGTFWAGVSLIASVGAMKLIDFVVNKVKEKQS